MTLGELKRHLKEFGIKSVGSSKIIRPEDKKTDVTLYFTADEKVVFPHRLKTVHLLTLPTNEDSQRVNKEQIKALKRALIPDWDEE